MSNSYLEPEVVVQMVAIHPEEPLTYEDLRDLDPKLAYETKRVTSIVTVVVGAQAHRLHWESAVRNWARSNGRPDPAVVMDADTYMAHVNSTLERLKAETDNPYCLKASEWSTFSESSNEMEQYTPAMALCPETLFEVTVALSLELVNIVNRKVKVFENQYRAGEGYSGLLTFATELASLFQQFNYGRDHDDKWRDDLHTYVIQNLYSE